MSVADSLCQWLTVCVVVELFEAVEHQQMERAKEIIENNTVDINR